MAGSSYINHFLQPDSIIPDWTNPQSLNRYAYVGNNPIVRNDPSGHSWEDCEGRSNYGCKIHKKNVHKVLKEGGYYEKKAREEFENAINNLLGSGDNNYCTDFPGGKTCLWELQWTPSDPQYKVTTNIIQDFLRDLGNTSPIDDTVGWLGFISTVLVAAGKKGIPGAAPALVWVRQFAIDKNYAQIHQFGNDVNSYIDHNPNNEIKLTFSYTERMTENHGIPSYTREGSIAFEVINDPSQDAMVPLLEQPAQKAYDWLSANVGE